MRPHEVKTVRTEVLGLHQGDFARLIGVSRNTIVSWEKGRTPVPDLQAGIIRQLEQEAKRRENVEEWARGLLSLAVGGLFGLMLGKLFSNDHKATHSDET